MPHDLAFHDAAGIFPLMEDDAFDALVEDVRQHGLRERIELLDGTVIDGRNRYRACLLAGAEPETVEIETDDPVAYVLSKNLHRRHLDETQRGMAAARVKEFYKKAAKERQTEGQKHGGQAKHGSMVENLPPSSDAGKSRDQAGRALNVSGRTVDFAAKVLREGSAELVKAVDAGDLPVSVAARLAELPKAEQKAALKAGKPAIREAIAKPIPAIPIGDVIFRAFRELLDRVDSIYEQFGSAKKMLSTKAWRESDIGPFSIVVKELAEKFGRLHEEVEEYVQKSEA